MSIILSGKNQSCWTEITGSEVLSENPFLVFLVNGIKVVTGTIENGVMCTCMCVIKVLFFCKKKKCFAFASVVSVLKILQKLFQI